MTLKFRQLIQALCRARSANSKMKFWSSSIKSISAASHFFAAFLSEGDSYFPTGRESIPIKCFQKMWSLQEYSTERCHLNLCVQFPTVTSTLRTEGMWEDTGHFSESSRKCLISGIQGFKMVHWKSNSELQIRIKLLLVLLELRTLLYKTVASFFLCQMETVGKNSTLVGPFFF